MRREERRAEAAVSRCSPVSSSSSSSRLASTEVSGVRSSCEASATNSRWRASAPSVSARASPSDASIASSVWASSATSSSASVCGIFSDGSRVCSIRRAAAASCGDRLHRAARHGQAGQQGQEGAAEDAEGQEDLHAVCGVLHLGDRLGVLERPRARPARDRHRAGLDAPAAGLARARQRRPEVGRVRRCVAHVVVLGDDADGGAGGGGRVAEVDRSARGPHDRIAVAVRVELQPRLADDAVGAGLHLAPEVLVDLARGEHADDHGEAAEDHERQRRGAAGQPPADRQPLIRGGRSPRRGPYGGVEAPHRLPAFFAGSRRRPRSCW